MLDGTLIGACGIDPRDEGTELGYWLGAGYWGHGFMTEAARAVIDYAFGDLRHERCNRAPGSPIQRRAASGEMRVPMDGRSVRPHPRRFIPRRLLIVSGLTMVYGCRSG